MVNSSLLYFQGYDSSAAASSDFYDELINNLAASGSPAIMLAVTADEAVKIFEAAKVSSVLSSSDYLWIAIDEWTKSDIVWNVPVGTLGIYPVEKSLSTAYLGPEFMSLWSSLNSSEYSDEDGDRETISKYSGYVVDAVFALALSYQDILNKNFQGDSLEQRQQAFNSLIDYVTFKGVTGSVSFTSSGDRGGGVFEILNVYPGNIWNTVGFVNGSILTMNETKGIYPDGSSWHSSNNYSNQYIPDCPPGEEPIFQNSDKGGAYVCSSCIVGYYKPYHGSEKCKICPIGADCNNIGIAVPCILPSYWRPQPPEGESGNFDRYRIFLCEVKERCLGGCSLNETCNFGIQQSSPVCAICDENYYENLIGNCAKCPGNPAVLLALRYALLCIVITAVVNLLYYGFSKYIKYLSVNMNTESDTIVLIDKANSSNGEKVITKLAWMWRISGLSVTFKLTISFIQIIGGALGKLNIEWTEGMIFQMLN